jgi:hypothetical protein
MLGSTWAVSTHAFDHLSGGDRPSAGGGATTRRSLRAIAQSRSGSRSPSSARPMILLAAATAAGVERSSILSAAQRDQIAAGEGPTGRSSAPRRHRVGRGRPLRAPFSSTWLAFLVVVGENHVNIPYIIGRMAMMGTADRLPLRMCRESRRCQSGSCWITPHSTLKT